MSKGRKNAINGMNELINKKKSGVIEWKEIMKKLDRKYVKEILKECRE